MTRKSSASHEGVAFAISAALAPAVSVAAAKLVFGDVTLWAVIGVAVVACLVSGLGAGTLVEGIVITIIIGVTGMVAVSALSSISFPAFWIQLLLSAVIGICIGQLVLGTYYEFFRPSNVRDDLPPKKHPRQNSRQNYSPRTGYDSNKVERQESDSKKVAGPDAVDRKTEIPRAHDSQQEDAPQTQHRQRGRVLQEYDTVRVVRLDEPDREFDGSDGVCRAPALGDVAVITHEYAPDDPTACVLVEMVDDDGLTIWLADFERIELEFVYRSE